jgi:ATP-binding cassette subfamily F protein 3
MLAGELEPTSGSYEFGHNTKVGYYAQHHAETLRREATVYEEGKYCAKDATQQRIRAVLGAMLCGEREIEKRVGVLSGGERARVALAQLMIDPGNVLLMDEPTNHLDLQSSERLAEALDTFDGTLLFVSHNRAFIRALATTIWLVQDGGVVRYPGSFDDYLVSCAQRDQAPVAVSGAPEAKSLVVTKNQELGLGGAGGASQKGTDGRDRKSSSKSDDKPKERGRRREDAQARKRRNAVLRPLQKRADELEKRVGTLEKKLAGINTELSTPEVYEDAPRRDELLSSVSRVQAELDVAMETWAEVQEELDAKTAEFDAE